MNNFNEILIDVKNHFNENYIESFLSYHILDVIDLEELDSLNEPLIDFYNKINKNCSVEWSLMDEIHYWISEMYVIEDVFNNRELIDLTYTYVKSYFNGFNNLEKYITSKTSNSIINIVNDNNYNDTENEL